MRLHGPARGLHGVLAVHAASRDKQVAVRGALQHAHLRPMRRLTSYTVRVGLTVAWFLAESPIRRSVSVNATYEGVMRLP